MASPVPKNTFFEPGEGMARPYKWYYTKKIITFYMISGKVKFYIKIVENGEVQNFVVDNFFI